MPADHFLPAYDACRHSPHPLPTLAGDEPGLSSVRTDLPLSGPKGVKGHPSRRQVPLAPSTDLGPTVAYGRSVRSRASTTTTTTTTGKVRGQ